MLFLVVHSRHGRALASSTLDHDCCPSGGSFVESRSQDNRLVGRNAPFARNKGNRR
jgi:hypothetical protein